MLTSDLADSPLASHWPDIAGDVDSPFDLLREEIEDLLGKGADRDRLFDLIEQAEDRRPPLRSAPALGRAPQSLFEKLRSIAEDTRLSIELRCQAIGEAIGANDPHFSESYQYYADALGLTRACLHGKARKLQRRLGLRARRDKKDDARAKSVAAATGPRSERQVKTSGVLRRSARSLFSFFPGLGA